MARANLLVAELIRIGTLEAMDHVFKDTVSEEEEAQRRAIESALINAFGHSDDSSAR